MYGIRDLYRGCTGVQKQLRFINIREVGVIGKLIINTILKLSSLQLCTPWDILDLCFWLTVDKETVVTLIRDLHCIIYVYSYIMTIVK